MKILISQQAPSNPAQYDSLQKKFGANIEFHPFFINEPVTSKEFRAEKINLPDYTAIVFFSRLAIDSYFKLCEEMRFKVPETMKYFCSTEAVAMYLQKHIVYRKRKIFYGAGTAASVVDLIGPKHKGEKFLITMASGASADILTDLLDKAGVDYSQATFVKAVSQDLHDVDLHSYDVVVMCNQSDVDSLKENYPDFTQGSEKYVSFGKSVVKSMEDAGLEIAVKAPTPEAPSVAKAVELYLSSLK